MACRSTRSWQSRHIKGCSILAIGSICFISGCGNAEKLDLSPKPLFTSVERVGPPNFGKNTPIVLRNDGQTLHVGDPMQKAFGIFSKPRKSYEFRDLPSQFGDGYRARGWESDLEAYGVITFEDQLVVAVRTLMKVEDGRVLEAVQNAKYEMGKETQSVLGTKARYWFWEIGQHRKMICSMATGNGEYNLTVAIGEKAAMNALRMSVQHAERDSRRADAAPTTPSVQ